MDSIISEIERIVADELRNSAMITHDFNHCYRVGIGSRWFVKILGGDKEDEKLAYIAGLLHDIVRPATEKIDHAVLSANKAREILEKLGLPQDTIEKIVLPIKDHRRPTQWTSVLHQSVYLADKILEQMGAYIVFRRCVFVGECEDYINSDPLRSIEHQFQKRLQKFDENAFPLEVKNLVRYQYTWPEMFLKSLEKGEAWAVTLAKEGFKIGENKSSTVDEFIRNFNPEDDESEKFQREALDYIEGKKFLEFKTMIKNKNFKILSSKYEAL